MKTTDSTLSLYPVEAEAPTSINYTAKVNGQDAYVYHFSGFAGGDVSWVTFDFTGEVSIAVTALRNIGKVQVSPQSAGHKVTLEGNTATITLREPARIFLKWDDAFELPFYIFANPPEQNVPRRGAPGVVYFGPGTHRPGMIHLHSDSILYLAPGAMVYGVVDCRRAGRVKIVGRGILCGAHVTRTRFNNYELHGGVHDQVSVHDCTDVEVEGITVLDAFTWTFAFHNCDRVRVSNVKILNEREFSTDGVNPANSRHVLIEDCFFRCKDDCVSIKGLDWEQYPENPRAMHDITVRNCVFWSDNNNVVVVGSETRSAYIRNILFENIDIIRMSNTCGDYAGALAIICLHDTEISNIRFENIRIEYCLGPYFNFFYTDSIFRIPGHRLPQGGKIRDITLKNISVLGGPHRRAYIRGYDESRIFEDVVIENFSDHGRVLEQGNDVVEVNKFTANVRFIAGKG